MEWTEALMGSGLLGGFAGFIYREGKHKQRFKAMEEKVDKLEETVGGLAEQVQSQEVEQKFIRTSLEYIKVGVDELRGLHLQRED